MEDMFVVLDSVHGSDDEPRTYSDAVIELNRICSEYEAKGWTVETGWASSGNYAAARAYKEGKFGRYISIERDDY